LGSTQQGGAIFCNDASPFITNCIFDSNTGDRGGAIGVTDISSPIITQSLFVNNEALGYGGAIFSDDGNTNITISYCTFYGTINPPWRGTLEAFNNGHLGLDHTILAFASSGYSAFVVDASDIQLNCCNIFGNPAGNWYGNFASQLGINGNISLDPIFCLDDNSNQPFGIHEDSPCSPTFNPDCGLIGYGAVSCESTSSVADEYASGQQARFFSCYPNPFNPRTTLSFNLPVTGLVELRIYSLDGRLVTTLINEVIAAGHHEIRWNGQDDQNRGVASGVFLVG